MNNSKPGGRTRNAGTRTPQGLDQVWETRKTLAKHEMAFDPDTLEARFADHTYFSKEAASGGAGVGGGGCGCN